MPSAMNSVEERCAVCVDDSEEHGAQGGACRAVHGADHAEVDESDPTVGLDEEVARVRIGMNEAVLEDHAEHRGHRAMGEQAAIDSRSVDPGPVVDLQPPQPFEDENPCGAQLSMDRRDVNREIAGEAAAKPFEVVGLQLVVELGPQGGRELLAKTIQVVAARRL